MCASQFDMQLTRKENIGAESDQLLNICSFAVRCPSTQWHKICTGSGNVPYVQFGSVSDFIPEPRCSKFTMGLQTRRRKKGCTRGPIGSGRKGREWQELRYELSDQAGAWGPNLTVLWLWAIDLRNSDLLGSVLFVGGSAPPFIDEGDGFTSERERVRMLSSLAAHAGGYKIMVGTHKTVNVTVVCQMHVGGCVAFIWSGRCWHLQRLFDA